MGKLLAIFIILLVFLQITAVSALTASEARQLWYDAKQRGLEAQAGHRQAKIDWAASPTEENNQLVIGTGKTVLNAALDEAEAWLVWKNLDAEENPEVPDELKQAIQADVEANLAKIDELRTDVEGINTKLELGLVFLKMVGKYLELLSDVARNVGMYWVHIGNTRADTIADYEAELRAAAEGIPGNEQIIAKLGLARTELATARTNIDNAEAEYGQVRLPGTPLIKFANGNNYLRIARGNLLSAANNLNQAYALLVAAGGES